MIEGYGGFAPRQADHTAITKTNGFFGEFQQALATSINGCGLILGDHQRSSRVPHHGGNLHTHLVS